MRRFVAAFIACLLIASVSAPAAFAASSKPSTKPVPRVVFIVGPAGSATVRYRTQARAAAAIARQYTPDVVELYSPDATWPAVKQALAGASLVVYMGHGNGWPSKYRDSLNPAGNDGFGLNPAAGGGDDSHQYFGEASIAAQVKLAKNAVVLLNHLCYASGNSEPQFPEGTLDEARQRVDNYAAGFIKAGASAVIAEAWSAPSYMVKAILGGGRSIQNAWQNAPSANHNRFAFDSVRSPGYIAQMDPETPAGGYTRSIVMKGALAPTDVLAGSSGSATAPAQPRALPTEPSLISTGLKFGAPAIHQLPSAGTTGHLDVAFKIKDRKSLPKGVQASARWDPIDVAIVPADPANEVVAADPANAATGGSPTTAGSPTAVDRAGSSQTGPTASAGPASTPTRGPASTPSGAPASAPSGGPASTPSASPSATPGGDPSTATGGPADAPAASDPATDPASVSDDAPRVDAPSANVDLVAAEHVGDVVAPAAVTFGKTAMAVPVTMPSIPGKYRLTIRLHDPDGVEYDAATQALIPSLIVRVTGDYDGAIQAAPTATLTAGHSVEFGVRVVNLGVKEWGHNAVLTASDFLDRVARDQPAHVIGQWISLSVGASLPADPASQTSTAALPIGLAPGGSADAVLGLTVPSAPGDYLLFLDIVTPERGSLVASGADPTLVRVTVLPAR